MKVVRIERRPMSRSRSEYINDPSTEIKAVEDGQQEDQRCKQILPSREQNKYPVNSYKQAERENVVNTDSCTVLYTAVGSSPTTNIDIQPRTNHIHNAQENDTPQKEDSRHKDRSTPSLSNLANKRPSIEKPSNRGFISRGFRRPTDRLEC
jgi:hypothetical protein